jgi:hypothetical protein
MIMFAIKFLIFLQIYFIILRSVSCVKKMCIRLSFRLAFISISKFTSSFLYSSIKSIVSAILIIIPHLLGAWLGSFALPHTHYGAISYQNSEEESHNFLPFVWKIVSEFIIQVIMMKLHLNFLNLCQISS